MPRYQLQAFDNTDGLGDVLRERWEVEVANRQAAVAVGMAKYGGPRVRVWIQVDELELDDLSPARRAAAEQRIRALAHTVLTPTLREQLLAKDPLTLRVLEPGARAD